MDAGTEPSKFLKFKEAPYGTKGANGELMLNRWSKAITGGFENPGAQAMLYAAGVKSKEDLKSKSQVVLDLGRTVKDGLEKEGMIGWQYSTPGVSDAITMGNEGMRFSLPSRDLIADSIESTTCAQHHDACIAIPGCDKNMPGCVMAMARHNRPSLMVYGGTIAPGYSPKNPQTAINISSCFETHMSHVYGQATAEDLEDVIMHACPGSGACAGMYTANTLATAIECMGLTLPGSSSTPAENPQKKRECLAAAATIKTCMEKNILPRDLITKRSFENALVITMALGGSTNACLHFLAMAHAADVADFTIDDFQRVSNKMPYIADLKPSGKYYMSDLYDVGGVPAVCKLLIAANLLDGGIPTVTGKTLAENVAPFPSLTQGQAIINLEKPLKTTGHIQILRGNLAPGGAVAKITGKEGTTFVGKALVFDSEELLVKALLAGEVKPKENTVLVVRYEGPKGGPGMPEQLKVSAALIGAGLKKNTALITDGRYSGASHGFIVGHIVPEAQTGGPLAIVQDGDVISIDAETNKLSVDLSEEEIRARMEGWSAPPLKVNRGTLAKYARLVSDASHGAVLDLF